MKKIHAVIFDMDGVIFDSEYLWKIKFVEANEKFGISLSEEYRQSICGQTEEVIRRGLRQMLSNVDADEYRDYIVDGVNSMVRNGEFEIKSGALEVIGFLKKHGIKTALATSSSRRRAEGMFKVKGLSESELFDAVVYGDEVGNRSKPDPYIFEVAAKKLGVENAECIVVEDSINGIKAAVAGGFVPVMAEDLIPPDDFCVENCYRIIKSLKEFAKIVGEVL